VGRSAYSSGPPLPSHAPPPPPVSFTLGGSSGLLCPPPRFPPTSPFPPFLFPPLPTGGFAPPSWSFPHCPPFFSYPFPAPPPPRLTFFSPSASPFGPPCSPPWAAFFRGGGGGGISAVVCWEPKGGRAGGGYTRGGARAGGPPGVGPPPLSPPAPRAGPASCPPGFLAGAGPVGGGWAVVGSPGVPPRRLPVAGVRGGVSRFVGPPRFPGFGGRVWVGLVAGFAGAAGSPQYGTCVEKSTSGSSAGLHHRRPPRRRRSGCSGPYGCIVSTGHIGPSLTQDSTSRVTHPRHPTLGPFEIPLPHSGGAPPFAPYVDHPRARVEGAFRLPLRLSTRPLGMVIYMPRYGYDETRAISFSSTSSRADCRLRVQGGPLPSCQEMRAIPIPGLGAR